MLDNNIYVYIHTNYLTFTGFSSDWKHLKDLPLSWGVRKSSRIEVFMKSNHRQLPIVWPSSSRGWQDSWDPVGWQSPPSFPVEVGRYVSLPHQIWHSLFFFASFWFGGIQYFKNKGKSVHHKSFPTLPFRKFSGAQIQRSLESSESDSSSDSWGSHGDLIRPHPRSCAVARCGRCNRTSQKSSVTLRCFFCSKNLLIPMISNDKIIKSQACQKSWESSLKIVDCVPFGTAFGGTYPQTSAPVWLLCPWTKRYQAVLLFRLSDSTLVFPPKVVLCRTAHCLLFFLEQ